LATRLSGQYIADLVALKKSYSRLMAVGSAMKGPKSQTVGGGGWAVPTKTIRFPKPPVLKLAADDRFEISVSEEDKRFWKGIASTLVKDPSADVTVKVQ
jgi:hypothetical protein